MKAQTSQNRLALRVDGAGASAPAYPDAVVAHGLIFTSGVRPASPGAGFAGLPDEGRRKSQGVTLADRDEGLVARNAWGAHAALEVILGSAGSDNGQILRQHVWQKDKRFFPVYEDIRIVWQPSPSPSSGLGVGRFPTEPDAWIGLDAIAVAPGFNPTFTRREVVADVQQKDLPSASHYSQAVRSGPLLFTAGHIAIQTQAPGKPVVRGFDDLPPEGRTLATGRSHPDSRDGPIAAQTWYVYDQLRRLLERGGLTLDDVVLSTVYLADPRDFAVFHRVHRAFFFGHQPALCVSVFNEVGHRGCLIEIELTALDPAAGLKCDAVDWPVPRPIAAPAARWAGPFLFLSGLPGLDDAGQLIEAGDDHASVARAQSRAALKLMRAVLASAGLGLEQLAKLTVYLSFAEDLPIFEEERRKLMPDGGALPAFEAVVVTEAGPIQGSFVQLDAIAAAPMIPHGDTAHAAQLVGGAIDHLGIAVPDLDASTAFYRDVLGLREVGRKSSEAGGLAVVFLLAPPPGLSVELLAPLPGARELTDLLGEHTVQAFLRRQPRGGLHHVCFRTTDFASTRAKLEASGLSALGNGKGAVGASGKPVLFFAPTSPAGIIVEIKDVGDLPH